MKELYIERREKLLRIAVKKDNQLQECYIEEEDDEAKSGQIYKGIVQNIIPAIKCAFIDIGKGKNCYMYLDRKFNNLGIKKNQEIIVEVLKESIGDKGPKVTNAFSIPGRYVVLETLNKEIGFSSKIDSKEFKKLVLEGLCKPEDIGIKIRTNAEKVSIDAINSELSKLVEIHKTIVKQYNFSSKPKLLYEGEGILDKILRDKLDTDTEKIYIDNSDDFEYIKAVLKHTFDVSCNVELFKENRTLFDYFGIEKEIIALRNNKVPLKSGGYIIVDKTEGMYVVDVNSGKSVKGSNIEATAYSTNLEAAYEASRQIKLRNLAGIIVIDFIDMSNKFHKNEILDILNTSFAEDKNKTVIYPFTELNLVQIARRRLGKPILDYIMEECKDCKGSGRKLKFSYVNELLRNEIVRLSADINAESLFIQISYAYEKEVYKNLQQFIENIGALQKKVYLEFVEKSDFIKVEPIIFNSQVEKLQKFKIYG